MLSRNNVRERNGFATLRDGRVKPKVLSCGRTAPPRNPGCPRSRRVALGNLQKCLKRLPISLCSRSPRDIANKSASPVAACSA